MKYSLRKGMTDDERYEALKNETVGVPKVAVTGELREAVARIGGMKKMSEAETELVEAARKYKYIKQNNKDNQETPFVNARLGMNAYASKGTIHESLEKGTSAYMLAALMPVFKETYENAVPILLQNDRYLYTVQDRTHVEEFACLLGAFNYDGESRNQVQHSIKKWTHVRKSCKIALLEAITGGNAHEPLPPS